MTHTIHILLVDDDPAENLIMRGVMKKVLSLQIKLHYCQTIGAALDFIASGTPVSMVLMDNRLQQCDFRETVPILRQNGYIGPIGVISLVARRSLFSEIRGIRRRFPHRQGRTRSNRR